MELVKIFSGKRAAASSAAWGGPACVFDMGSERLRTVRAISKFFGGQVQAT